jgi:hypothetical protein
MHADGKEKMENEQRLCSRTAEEALRVTPAPPRRGDDDDDDRAWEDRMAMAATTALSATNHTASDPSHAGRDDDGGHHHPFAILVKLDRQDSSLVRPAVTHLSAAARGGQEAADLLCGRRRRCGARGCRGGPVGFISRSIINSFSG